MSAKKKIIIGVIVVVVLGAIVGFSVNARRKDLIEVESGSVTRRDSLIAKVSATGEIKPKEFVELQAEISGVITDLFVKEGDVVDKGTVLLRIDPVQTRTEAQAQEAVLSASQSEARSQEAQIAVQQSNVERDLASVRVSEAEVERARQAKEFAQSNFDRKQELFEDNLISRDAYESAKNDLVSATSALTTAEARLEQAKAQYEVSHVILEQAKAGHKSAESRVAQQRAFLARSQDLLSKTVIRSPLSGVITQLNVEVGERAVPGTLNNPSATLMIIADLSVIEAEVEVDETDIVDLKIGQQAEVKVDALPDEPLKGTVTEIGNSAIQRASGQQEAKDFKVVIQLVDPPQSLRPGLSCTGEITTAERADILSIPIQALAIREFPVDENGDIIRKDKDAEKEKEKDSVDASKEEDEKREEIEGVFRLNGDKVEFVKVTTGITGDTEIEILSGLKEGDEIVTGSYRTLRTLGDGDAVKAEKKERG